MLNHTFTCFYPGQEIEVTILWNLIFNFCLCSHKSFEVFQTYCFIYLCFQVRLVEDDWLHSGSLICPPCNEVNLNKLYLDFSLIWSINYRFVCLTFRLSPSYVESSSQRRVPSAREGSCPHWPTTTRSTGSPVELLTSFPLPSSFNSPCYNFFEPSPSSWGGHSYRRETIIKFIQSFEKDIKWATKLVICIYPLCGCACGPS